MDGGVEKVQRNGRREDENERGTDIEREGGREGGNGNFLSWNNMTSSLPGVV